MRGKRLLVSVLLLGLMLGAVVGLSMAQDEESETSAAPQAPVGTAFTYQGRLSKGGSPYTGQCDFRLSLHDALSEGNQVGSAQTIAGVDVEQGLFTVALNSGNEFGDGAFNGEGRWLRIQVKCTGDGSYTPLTPRQALTPAPYALALPALRIEPAEHELFGYSPNLIGGYWGNEVTAGVVGATIAGGGNDDVPNRVTADYATVGGGDANRATAIYAVVGGGIGNQANGIYAAVSGGCENEANNSAATAGGGLYNVASGRYATIPGGRENEASGDYSFAAGRQAKATHNGSFVLADSTYGDFASTRNNSLRARLNGGATFVLNDDNWVRLWTYTNHLIDTSTGAHLTTGGTWTNDSDQEAKENFAPVDGQDVLAQVVAMPIQTWNYKAEDPAVRRMGPTAQDFYAAFGLGEDERHISTIDADGVALAAIQGLYEQVQEQAARIQALEAENATMQQMLEDLSVRLAALEAAQTAGEAGP
ncbi:MAG: tail fiber domain-containing protein [Anaerolineae bacterium]|jgi:hypothetical protein